MLDTLKDILDWLKDISDKVPGWLNTTAGISGLAITALFATPVLLPNLITTTCTALQTQVPNCLREIFYPSMLYGSVVGVIAIAWAGYILLSGGGNADE